MTNENAVTGIPSLFVEGGDIFDDVLPRWMCRLKVTKLPLSQQPGVDRHKLYCGQKRTRRALHWL